MPSLADIRQRCEQISNQYSLGPAFGAIIVTALIGLVGVGLSTHGFGVYGYGLFVFMPFAQGAFAAFFAEFQNVNRSARPCELR